MDLSALGPTAAVVIVVMAFLKFLGEVMNKLQTSIDKNTEVTKENMLFLKNLNGKLVKTVNDKIKDK